MSIRKVFSSSFLIASLVVLPTVIQAVQDKWTRQFLGDSLLSLELPGKLVTGETEQVNDGKDWVKSTTEYNFENDDYFVQCSVFTGDNTTKADGPFLSKVMASVLEGVQQDGTTAVKVDSNKEDIDKMPALRETHRVGTGKEQFLMKVALVGENNKVYAIIAVAFPDVPGSVDMADRTFKSIRFTKTIK